MKKSLLIYVLIFFFISYTNRGFTQTLPIGKKSITLGANGGYWSHSGDLYEDVEGNKATTTSLDLDFGYFVANHLALGISLDYRVDKQDVMKLIDRGIGPYCSYYFGNMKKEEVPGTFYPYIGISYLWKLKSQEFMYLDYLYTDEKKIGSFGIRAGGLFMIANSVGIYANIGYDFDNGDFEWTYDNPDYEQEGGNNAQKGGVFKMGIGIRLFIYKKSFE